MTLRIVAVLSDSSCAWLRETVREETGSPLSM